MFSDGKLAENGYLHVPSSGEFRLSIDIFGEDEGKLYFPTADLFNTKGRLKTYR